VVEDLLERVPVDVELTANGALANSASTLRDEGACSRFVMSGIDPAAEGGAEAADDHPVATVGGDLSRYNLL
jgi:hypothetical protein